MNKNLILLLIVLAVGIGAYVLLRSNDIPTIDDTAEVTERNGYVGMTTAAAKAKAQTTDTAFRIVEINGELQPTTRDFREGRINASVVDGVITSYTVESRDPAAEADSATATDHKIIGLTTADAKAYAEAKGVDFRIGTLDGEDRPVTLDFRPGRITAEVMDGVVVGYTVE